jgi:hypothetical protein
MAAESNIDDAKLKRLDLSPHLVHQILLSERSWNDYPLPALKVTKTPAFEVYRAKLLQQQQQQQDDDDSEMATDLAFVMKRGFHSTILDTIEQRGDLSPLLDLLLELHHKLRGLVPNRPDLHNVLSDHRAIPALSEAPTFSTWIVDAARVLAMLESEFQSETTKLWISDTIQANQQQRLVESTTMREQQSWMVCSLMFLMDKTDVAQSEKDAFYFSSVVVPYLLTKGVGFRIERESLLQKFGPDLPVTREWIGSLIQEVGSDGHGRSTK